MSSKKWILFIAGLFLIIITVTAFTLGGKKVVAIGAAQAGKTISLRQGDTLVVTLDGNTTTGYTWEASQDVPVLKQVGTSEFVPGSNKLGAPGQITLKFQAVQAGQATLNLIYQRPFEKGVQPAKIFTINVTVR